MVPVCAFSRHYLCKMFYDPIDIHRANPARYDFKTFLHLGIQSFSGLRAAEQIGFPRNKFCPIICPLLLCEMHYSGLNIIDFYAFGCLLRLLCVYTSIIPLPEAVGMMGDCRFPCCVIYFNLVDRTVKCDQPVLLI